MKTSEFKKLIKECIREVLKEELPLLLERKTTILPTKNIGEIKTFDNELPSNNGISTPFINIKNIPRTGDPLIDLLNETKTGMSGDDWKNFGHFDNTSNFNPNNFIYGNEPVVGTVDQMLQTSNKSVDINNINIDVVPNFSNLMGKLKETGQI